MKKIVRLLALVGIVSFAAIPPAMSNTQGWCSYTCVRFNPFDSQQALYPTTYGECCQNLEELCPPGYSPRGVSFDGNRCA